MKQRKTSLLKGAWLTALIFLCAWYPCKAWASVSDKPVTISRNIVQLDADNGRKFQINYRADTTGKEVAYNGLQDIFLLLDASEEMNFLVSKPEKGARFVPGVTYEDKIDENAALYTEQEENYIPIFLNNGEWQTETGETVGKRLGKTDSFSTVVYEKGTSYTRLEKMREEVKGFLKNLGEVSPSSTVNILFLGLKNNRAILGKQAGRDLEELFSALDSCGTGQVSQRKFASALNRAAELAASREKQGRLFVISIVCGDRDAEDDGVLNGVEKSRWAVQKIWNMAGKSYCFLLNDKPEENVKEFWNSMCSAPLETYFQMVDHQTTDRWLVEACGEILPTRSVEVIQELDPRFQIPESEAERVQKEGARIEAAPNGASRVFWEAAAGSSPWHARLVIEAKRGFPGGNDIPVDGELSGIYRSGEKLAGFPEDTVNVQLALVMENVEQEIFLGEKVKINVYGRDVEHCMLWQREPDWCGRERTGTFSYFWETEQGNPVGTLEQLAQMEPDKDQNYRFLVKYRPSTSGIRSIGVPVKESCASALYVIKVVSGTIKVKAEVKDVFPGAEMFFSLEGNDGVFYKKAQLEADPESRDRYLEVEFGGLPYGSYVIRPLAGGFAESQQKCFLGICQENDTVKAENHLSTVKFTCGEDGETQSRCSSDELYRE